MSAGREILRRRIQGYTVDRRDRLLAVIWLLLLAVWGLIWPLYVWIHIRPVWPELVLPLVAPSVCGWLWQVFAWRRWGP